MTAQGRAGSAVLGHFRRGLFAAAGI